MDILTKDLRADLSVAARELMRALGRDDSTQVEISERVSQIVSLNEILVLRSAARVAETHFD